MLDTSLLTQKDLEILEKCDTKGEDTICVKTIKGDYIYLEKDVICNIEGAWKSGWKFIIYAILMIVASFFVPILIYIVTYNIGNGAIYFLIAQYGCYTLAGLFVFFFFKSYFDIKKNCWNELVDLSTAGLYDGDYDKEWIYPV